MLAELHNRLSVIIKRAQTLLFPWLFPSCRVAGMTDGLPSPYSCCPIHLLALSLSFSVYLSLSLSLSLGLALIVSRWDASFRLTSSSLPFPRYIRLQHFHLYLSMWSSSLLVTCPYRNLLLQSYLCELFGSLSHNEDDNMNPLHLVVFLSTNPSLRRHCERRLIKIDGARRHRELQLERAQKLFFLRQAFDHDSNLRFGKQVR